MSDSNTSSVASSQQAAAKGAIAKMALTGFVLIGLAAAGVFFTFQFAENERERELKQWQIRLGIVADSRFADIDEWLDSQLGELNDLAENGSLQIYTGILQEAEDRDIPSPEADSLNTLLTAVADRAGFKAEIKGAEVQANVERVGVAGISILDKSGVPMVASPGMPPVEGQLRAFAAGVEKGERGVSDMFLNAAGNPAMAFLVPVFSVQGDQDASSQIATIIGVKEIASELYPLLKQPGNVDKTAEAVIVRRKGTSVEYLTPRSDGTAPLKKKLSLDTPNLAAAFAVDTPGGFGIRTDYQDKEVLLTVRAFSQVPWTLIYKIDTSESLAEAENRIRTIVLAFIGIIVLVFIGLIAVWYYGSSRRATEAATRFEALSQRFQGQRNFMHLVTDSQPNSIVVFDEGGHYRWFNQVALDLSGLERRDLFDKHIAAVLGPLEGKRVETWIKECLAKFEPTTYTHELTFDGRQDAVFKSDFIPLEAREEMPAGVLMVSQDITDSIRERERRERVLKQLVGALVSVVDRRDPYSANHSTRVGVVSKAVAEEMELPAIDVETAEIAGNLMNLGKITVPEEVLTKTDKLTDEEFGMIRDSIFTSAELVSDIEFDGNVAETLRALQEHVDGSGVPDGLTGDDIAISARIVAVSNAFVGMVSARSWREGMDFDKAIGFLMEDVGRKFDRRVVTALANYIDNRGGREAWRSYGERPEASD